MIKRDNMIIRKQFLAT